MWGVKALEGSNPSPSAILTPRRASLSAQNARQSGLLVVVIQHMKIKLTVEIALVFMAVVLVGTWQGWLKWPEGALISAALCVITALAVVRRINAGAAPKA